MKRSLSKILFFILKIFFSFLLAIVIFLITLFYTERGSRWVLNQIVFHSAHKISYQSFSGKIIHQFSIKNLQVKLPTTEITIADFSVNWLNFTLVKLNLLQLNYNHQFQTNTQLILQGHWWHPHWELLLSNTQTPQLKNIPPILLTGEINSQILSIQKIQSLWWPKNLNILARYYWHSSMPNHFAIHLYGQFNPYFLLANKNMAKNHLKVDVQINNQTNNGTLRLNELEGEVDGRMVQGNGSIHWSKDSLDWKNWFIHIDQSRLEFNGQLSKNSQLTWLIHIPNLSYWLPAAHGEIISQGKLKGDWENPLIQANANIQHVRWLDYGIANLQAVVSNQDLTHFILDLQANNVGKKTVLLQQCHLHGVGSWQKQMLQIAIMFSDLKFTASEWEINTAKMELSTQIKFDQNGRPLGNVQWQSWPIYINYQPDDETSVPIQINTGHLQINFYPQTVDAQMNLTSNWGSGSSQLHLPEWSRHQNASWFSQPVTGNLNWHFDQLKNLLTLFPALQNIQGKINLTSQIGGKLNAPTFNILLKLEHAVANWLTYNLTFKPIDLTIQGYLAQVLHVSGLIGSGSGNLHLDGNITQLFTQPNLQLKITGQNFLATNLFFYKIWASPNLLLSYQPQQMQLTGNILIPKARLNFTDYSAKVVSPSDDIVFASDQSTQQNFKGNLNLILGNNIVLTYGGLHGEIRGQVNLQQLNNNSTIANGQLQLVNGQYKAYGQVLTIQRGTATYQNAETTNPILDVEAVKTLHNISSLAMAGGFINGAPPANPDGTLLVGVAVTGSLSKHQVRLFSQPAGLTQSDILSYLILGVPATQAGNGGGQLLLSAAASLGGGRGGNAVTELQHQLSQTFGIDINMGTVSQYNPNTQQVTQGSALILQKALSPRLYLSYSASIGQNVNVFNVKYQIARSWMAQTESSVLGNGADIYYTIDK